MTLALTGVGVAGFSQNVSFSGTQVPLERVFQSVREQTGYVFMYTEDVIHTAQPVTINVKDAPLDKFLADVFKPQPLKYAVKGKSIFVSPKPRNAPVQPDKPVASPPRQITGMIADPEGRPLPGATVAVAGKNRSAMTNSEGVFTLEVNPGDILVITFVGFEKKELNVNESLLSGKVVHIPLTRATSLLDDVHIIAYGLTTRRLTTGSIAKLSGDDIRKQPVENPLLALSGRLPGVQISQTSGLAGAPVGVIIRGKSSIGAGTNPLYVID
ncbi:MAG TPA: carboxypeptidase-like regulatory domain-containing protein, partial [Puia sp.]|nr:carboxypeptidase-like regulatory domain-containing protein [Puia sp.]